MRTMTPLQAAKKLGVDVLTVRRWMKYEQVPYIRDGRKKRIPAKWVEQEVDRG